MAILHDQVKDLIETSKSQGEQIRTMRDQGICSDQHPYGLTVQNKMHTSDGAMISEGNSSENDMAYNGPVTL